MFARKPVLGLALMLLCLQLNACTRSKYRKAADKQSTQLIASRNTDYRWMLPPRPVEPAPQSRMSIPANLDCAPKPPDDPAAAPLMYCPDGHRNDKYWNKIPDAVSIDSLSWLDSLPRQSNGSVLVDQKTAIDLALIHSRDYQTQFESVYLTALSLTGNEFEFQAQWQGGTGVGFTATGKDLGNNKVLQVSDNLGFSRNLAGGGQVATNVLNSFFWDFGSNTLGSSGLLVSTFTQPLLRGAFRHVRLENLTQAERDLLYQVRNFARFRRQMYGDISAAYLSLLTQRQSILNAQVNVESLKANLIEHQTMRELGMVSQIQVDQVFQEYQNGRLTLLAAEQNLVSALDAFKFQLGLPPWLDFEVDEKLLKPFELVSQDLEEINSQVQQMYVVLLQYTPTVSIPHEQATQEQLYELFGEYVRLHNRVAESLPAVQSEYERWVGHLRQLKAAKLSENDQLDLQQQLDLAEKVGKDLSDLENGLATRQEFDNEVKQKIDAYHDPISAKEPSDSKPSEIVKPDLAAWKKLYTAVNGTLRKEISNLYIYQTQIRLFLIDVPQIQVSQEVAVTFAHQNRLDQMNRQAHVMDSFRKVEVAADALQSSLSLNGQVALGTDPNKANAFRFDSSANTYRAGVQFDGPLNRLNERNTYRASQVAYQQATRAYTAGRDSIANEVRAIMRQVELSRLNFLITRQQLVAASRQVDQAQINIRISKESNTNLTRDLLQSLQGLLAAKNNLIANWVQYRTLRIRLFIALELLYLDDSGGWINEDLDLSDLQGLIQPSDYFPFPVVRQSEVIRESNNADQSNSLPEMGESLSEQTNLQTNYGDVISIAAPFEGK